MEQPLDPNAHRYANMSYIAFLNRQQRMIERGALVDDFEDDEEGQSEDDSNVSGDAASPDDKVTKGKQTAKPNMAGGTATGFGAATSGTTPGINTTNLTPQIGGPVDYSKILVAGEGYGREFLKNEIDRFIKMLQDKQQVGQGILTFTRQDLPTLKRGDWIEDFNQKAGLFSDRGNEIEKIDGENEDEEEGTRNEKSEKNNDGDSLKASIKSKKAFSMAINDKTMPPAIKRLSTTAQIMLIFLIVIAIIEYAIIYK